MKILRESGEDYLETILNIEREKQEVRSIEVARRLGVSRASVSKALGVLRENGYVEPSYYGEIMLTEQGRTRAQEVRARHELLCRFLEDGLGVGHTIAEHDACRIEHIVSPALLLNIEKWMQAQPVSDGPKDIRLIAADMDGTLLDSKKRLPPQIIPLIYQLKESGIRFAAASGRQYGNLLTCFPGMERDMLFICENGAMVFGDGKLQYIEEIPHKMLEEPVRLIRSLPNTYVILCGEKCAWMEGDNPVFAQNAAMYYADRKLVPDALEAAKQDRICKIAVFHHATIETEGYPLFLQFKDRFQIALSGESWVDFMMPGVNKGKAMGYLQKSLELTPEQCMAFGDFLNDRELMQAVKYSYGMENGHPDLLAVCRFRAPSNDENGVVRILEQVMVDNRM